MPCKECLVMYERLQFVARRLAGNPMVELCREFGISRKIGYKIFDRCKECVVQGLTDRSRRPYRYAHQLPFQVENYILNVKREHTKWGARKIRERLIRRCSGSQKRGCGYSSSAYESQRRGLLLTPCTRRVLKFGESVVLGVSGV